MNINETLVPHILCAMSSAPDQQQSLSKIVRFVEERLGDEAKQITNMKSEVERALKIAVEFGLLSSHNNIVRLRYNPNSKPPLGFQVMDSQRESRRSSMQMDEEMEELMDNNSEATPINENKVATDTKSKNSKNPAKDTSDFSFFPVPSEIKRRRRKSRGRGKRKRSKSRRRRRRR